MPALGLLREIVGHPQIVRALLNALLHERVGHAYLFAGPEGVGKMTTALAFAQALFCTDVDQGEPCGQCRECRLVEHANHPDFHRVSPDGLSIKIEQVRDIQRKVMFRAYQGGRKVIIVEEAAAMTAEAANCLLKILEEPPDGTVFILLTALPQNLPATILSRCQQLIFKLLTFQELAEYLHKQHGLAWEEARLAATLSGGSLGKALAYLTGSLPKERDTAFKLAALLRDASCLDALEEADKASQSREQALTLLDMLACWYRDLLIWRETSREELLFNSDQVIALQKEAGYFETGCLVGIIEDVIKAKSKIMGNANIKLTLEALFLRLQDLGEQCQ